MSVPEKLHRLSLWVLTLCGVGAMVALAVNLVTAAAMLMAEKQKEQPEEH